MNYKVKIDDGVLKARLDGHHTIWMYRAPRSHAVEPKQGLYLLVDDRGYCCYVGETDNVKTRMGTHASHDKFCWWTHSIYFWDEGPHSAFSSTDDRRWYEKQLKEAIESHHPTFTKNVQNKPRPESGEDVLHEILALLDVIGFETNASLPCLASQGGDASEPTSQPQPGPRPPGSTHIEPTPHRNHRPPLGDWPTYTELARAIAERRGLPGTAGGIQQKLTNFWAPGRGRYAKANPTTRQMLEDFGVKFDDDGFVESCAGVPYPLP